jgi:hypothetical protein
VVYAVDHCLLLTGRIGGFMAKAEAASAKMTFGQLSSMRLAPVDAVFLVGFGVIAIALVVGFVMR